MAQTGFTPISLYYTTTAAAAPTAGNLVAGELAINTADGKLFYKDSAGVVQVIGTKGGVGSSTTTQVLYNNAGTIAGSANFVFDGTNVGIGTSSPTQKLTVISAGTTVLTSIFGSTTGAIATLNYNSIGGIQGYTNTGATSTGNITLQPAGGNLLVGTTTAQELLTVNKNAAFGTTADAFSELRFFNSTSTAGTTRVRATAGALAFLTSNAEAMRIDASQNVGIGTNSPAYKLDVAGISKGSTIQASGSPAGSFSANSIFMQNEGSSNNRMYYCGANTSTYGVFQEYSAYSNGTPLITRYVDSGQQVFYTDNAERMRITSAGDVLVGASATSSYFDGKLNVFNTNVSAGFKNNSTFPQLICWASSTSGTRTHILFATGTGPSETGSITTNGTTTTYNVTSDYRLKTVIGSVSDAGQRIDALKPIEYDWNTGGRTRGFLAHQFAEVYPDSVSGEKDAVDAEGKPKYQAMQASSSEVMADLISEIQSLRKRVAQLESK
jgi:hypothetical protein